MSCECWTTRKTTNGAGSMAAGATSPRPKDLRCQVAPGDRNLSVIARKESAMAVKPITKTLPDTYFNLVRQFPLIHIGGDQHLNAAQRMIDRLLQEDLDRGSQEYLDALTDLVETY